MGRVDCERRQDREDAVAVGRADPFLLLGAQRVPGEEVDALRSKGRDDSVMVGRGVAPHEFLARREAPGEDVARAHAARGGDGHAGGDTTLEAGDAHHEELIEVAREDREEACALQQRDGVILRELEDTGVERDPGELTIEEPVDGQDALLGVERRIDVELVRGGRSLDVCDRHMMCVHVYRVSDQR